MPERPKLMPLHKISFLCHDFTMTATKYTFFSYTCILKLFCATESNINTCSKQFGMLISYKCNLLLFFFLSLAVAKISVCLTSDFSVSMKMCMSNIYGKKFAFFPFSVQLVFIHRTGS